MRCSVQAQMQDKFCINIVQAIPIIRPFFSVAQHPLVCQALLTIEASPSHSITTPSL